jgi:hypothetical protein
VIKDDGSVVDITASAGASYSGVGFISFDSNHNMIFEQDNSGRSLFYMPIPSADRTSSTSTAGPTDKKMLPLNSANTTFPKFNGSNATIGIGGSGEDQYIYGGTGVTHYAQGPSDATSSVAYITSTYNTGWMNGDIKLATLSDTDATDVVGTNLIATSTLDTTDRLASHTYTSGSATFSLTEDSNAGTSAGYVWILFNVPLGKSYAVSIQCDTAFTPDGETRLVSVTTGVDVFPGQGTTDLRTLTFDHNNASAGVILYSSPVAGSTVTYTLSISEAEEDRSVNNKGLQVLGTVTKTAVATGA